MKANSNTILKENNYNRSNFTVIASKDKIKKNYIKREKLSKKINNFENKKYKTLNNTIKFYILKNIPTIKKSNNLLLMILLILFSPFISNKNINNINFLKLNSGWEISLTIQGSGNQNILCDQTVSG